MFFALSASLPESDIRTRRFKSEQRYTGGQQAAQIERESASETIIMQQRHPKYIPSSLYARLS